MRRLLAAAAGLRRAGERPGREPPRAAQPAGARQGALRQRLPRGGDRRTPHAAGALPPGRLALPPGPRLGPRAAPPRLERLPPLGGAHAAPLPPLRAAGGRHAALDRPLQGLRTDVRTLRRAALHRRLRRLGHRLQDRPLEHLAARQLVPALGRHDARRRGRQRGRG